MLWFEAILIAFISNIDNLGAGLSYGMRRKHISTVANLVIASITMLSTGLAMFLGAIIARTIPGSVISSLGGLLLIGIGIFTVLSTLHTLGTKASSEWAPTEGWPTRAERALVGNDVEHQGSVSIRSAIFLGLALSCNNFATGVGAGASRISPLTTTLLSGLFSLACVAGGVRLGSTLATRLFRRFAAPLGGLMLAGVGLSLVVR